MAGDISSRVSEVHDRIAVAAARVGRDPQEIRLMAVSKRVPAERVFEAVSAGLDLFGENRFQGSIEKVEEVAKLSGSVASRLEWHFIGHLQSNKVRKVLQTFDMIQSLDSMDLIDRIDRISGELGIVARALLQVNVSGAETQYGFSLDETMRAAEFSAGRENLRIEGLMTIGPLTESQEQIHRAFETLRLKSEEIDGFDLEGTNMHTLSMGMTGDFEIAVEEGSTLIRVGTAIFGPRN